MTPPTPDVCTVCGAPMAPGSDRCGRCGTLYGDHRVCPGCGAHAEVVEKGGVWTCAACGRPRVPMEKPGIPRSGRERAVLARVEQAHKRGIVAKGLGIAAVVADAFVGVVLAIAALAGFTGLAIAIALFAAFVAAMALFAFARSRAAQLEAKSGMREAIGLVALDVMRARGALSAGQLAEQMGIPVAEAEAALDRLPARDDVRVESVLDESAADGQLRYRFADPNERTLAIEEAADAEQAAFDAKLKAAMAEKSAKKE